MHPTVHFTVHSQNEIFRKIALHTRQKHFPFLLSATRLHEFFRIFLELFLASFIFAGSSRRFFSRSGWISSAFFVETSTPHRKILTNGEPEFGSWTLRETALRE
jgi:hypothetical protein